jgi:hypothetical protein
VPRAERFAAAALAGAFPADFDTGAVLAPAAAAAPARTARRRQRGGGAGAGAGAGAAAPPATLAVLEGVLNRTRPPSRFQQDGDARPRPHGIQPLVTQSPMVDDAGAAAAMAFIYTATTRGAARALWPQAARAAPGAAPGVAAGPLILSAPQATEAAVVEALAMSLGGQEYCNLNAAPGGGVITMQRAPSWPRPAGAPGPSGGGGGGGAMAEARARVACALPALPQNVRDDLQVCRREGRTGNGR